MKLILINAPPYAGKDTAALALRRYHNVTWGVLIERMSMPLKRAFAGIMDLDCFQGVVEPWESRKEQEISILGTSYRQFQIDLSEKHMKHLYGENIFARLLYSRIEEYLNTTKMLIVVPDCGFQIELDYLLDKISHSDIMLIQIERPDSTFDNDSREWVKAPPTITSLRLLNDDTQELFENLVIRVTENWIQRT